MNILFLSVSDLPHLSDSSISLDLLRALRQDGHVVTVVCPSERRNKLPTRVCTEDGNTVIRVRCGNIKKTNLIEKGITTVFLPYIYLHAIRKYLKDVKFDMVVYPTPPVTNVPVIRYIKKRDGAKSYLILRDIFPQNAVDLGILSNKGVKSVVYHYFRRKEKQLYAVSDRIGCMSPANVDYLLKHNPEIVPEKVGICVNSTATTDARLNDEQKRETRNRFGLPTDKTVFVFGGNLGKPQGIPLLLECLNGQRDNPDAFFVIVGDGTEFSAVENYCHSENRDNVMLIKRLSESEYDELAASCDVGLVFLDHRFTIPNYPSRILSYMRCGLPVLACTDTASDIREILFEGNFGAWCESNDTDSFDVCVTRFCEMDRAMLRTMGNHANAYLKEHFTVEKSRDAVLGKQKDKIMPQ